MFVNLVNVVWSRGWPPGEMGRQNVSRVCKRKGRKKGVKFYIFTYIDK